jgi:hypothetical protein
MAMLLSKHSPAPNFSISQEIHRNEQWGNRSGGPYHETDACKNARLHKLGAAAKRSNITGYFL